MGKDFPTKARREIPGIRRRLEGSLKESHYHFSEASSRRGYRNFFDEELTITLRSTEITKSESPRSSFVLHGFQLSH